jgi:hypothetical protein
LLSLGGWNTLYGKSRAPNMSMMGWQNRRISIVLAVCYGLAITVSGLLHDHGDGHDACCDPSAGAAAPHDCSADHPHHKGSPSRDPSPQRCPPHGGHCVVCQFLAQKTLPVGEVEEVTSVALVHEVVLAAPHWSIAPLVPSWHSRAPPDVA